MKLTRNKLRKLIQEAMIKPTVKLPPDSEHLRPKLDAWAAGREHDAMGREYADASFDELVRSFENDEEDQRSFSQKEFEYDYPMIKDPKFAEGVKELFDMFMYENKVFAGDIEDGMSLEEYKEMVSDDFMERIPWLSIDSDNPAIRHSFSPGKLPYPYQFKDIIKKIVEPVAEDIWKDWSGYFANNQ